MLETFLPIFIFEEAKEIKIYRSNCESYFNQEECLKELNETCPNKEDDQAIVHAYGLLQVVTCDYLPMHGFNRVLRMIAILFQYALMLNPFFNSNS